MMAEGGEKVACPEVQACEEYNETRPKKIRKNRKKRRKKNGAEKQEPGRFAEGPRHPGLSCPPPQ
jgi:hypothetical protein